MKLFNTCAVENHRQKDREKERERHAERDTSRESHSQSETHIESNTHRETLLRRRQAHTERYRQSTNYFLKYNSSTGHATYLHHFQQGTIGMMLTWKSVVVWFSAAKDEFEIIDLK